MLNNNTVLLSLTPSQAELVFRLVSNDFHSRKDLISVEDEDCLHIMQQIDPEKAQEHLKDLNFMKR